MAKYPRVNLGDLAASDKWAITIGPFGSKMKSDLYVSSGIPVIRGANISGGNEISGDWVFVTEDFAKTVPNCITRAGELLFPHRGAIGEVALVKDNHPKMVISSSLMKFRPDSKKALPEYLFYFFSSDDGRKEILRFSSSVGTPGIGQPLTSLRQFSVPLPDLDTQSRIAFILSALDEKIELNRQMNETLDALAQAIFKDWFVTFGPTRRKQEGASDPVAILGSLILDPTHAAEIAALFPDSFGDDGLPEGWIEREIGEDFDITMGQSPPGDTYNETGDGLPFFQGRRDFGWRFPSRRVYCSEPNRIAPADWTLVSVRAPVGDINRAWERCCIGRGVGAFMHRSKLASFTYYAGLHLREELASYDKDGTVFGSINQNQFKALKISGSNTDAAAAFDQIISSIDAIIRCRTEENCTLAETRDYLLPKLMSGEVRVRDVEKEVP